MSNDSDRRPGAPTLPWGAVVLLATLGLIRPLLGLAGGFEARPWLQIANRDDVAPGDRRNRRREPRVGAVLGLVAVGALRFLVST